MENYTNNINNYKLIFPENLNKLDKTTINPYLTFSSKYNKPMYIDTEAQAILLQILIKDIDKIKASNKNYDHISRNFKFKSLEKYQKYFSSNNKVKIIRMIYKTLYNEKKPPELTGVLPADMILVLNIKTLGEVCTYVLYALSCLFNGKNPDTKLMQLIEGKMGWREACMKKKFVGTDDVNRFEKTMTYLETLNCFSCFNLEISRDINEATDVIIDYILLFYLFYEALLKNCLKINIDMSFPKLDMSYLTSNMQSKLNSVNDKLIMKSISDNYLKGILINYLLMKNIGEHFVNREGLLLSYEQYDSYIIELFSLFQKEILDTKDKEMPFVCNYENCNFLFYNMLYYLSPKTGFKLDMNALDPLLFKNLIYTIFLILSNGEPIQKLEINLFPKENLENKIDIHKIYLNHIFYNKFINQEVPKDLQEINYNFNNHVKFNWKNKDNITNNVDITDDKIYDILFEDFNTNLFYLLVLMDKNSQTISESIKIDLPQSLLSHKKYIYSISYFIYNVFQFLNKKCLSINMSQFNLSTNIQIPESMKSFEKICLRNIKINNLKLKMSNISYILDLNSLPYSSCSLLCLSNLSYNDLINFVETLKTRTEEVSVLKHIKLKCDYFLFTNFNIIDDLFRNYYFPKSVSYISIRFKNELSTNEYFDLMWKVINAIACSENNPPELKVTIKIYYDEKEDPVSFNKLKENLENCFDFDKLNPNYLMIYDFSYREKKDKKEIVVELDKYLRNTKLDAYIKLSRSFDKNQKLQMKYLMPTCLKITRFLSRFPDSSNIKIHFLFVKSV